MKISFNSRRRNFLKVGLLGSMSLGLAACGSMLERPPESCKSCDWLRPDDRHVLEALVPVVLDGALPSNEQEYKQAINEVIIGIDFAVSHFPPTVQAEIRQLFWLLETPFTRSFIGGLWVAWHNASDKEIAELLNGWKSSDFDLLRVAYTALHDFVTASWYANPLSWQRIHYPGPPRLS